MSVRIRTVRGRAVKVRAVEDFDPERPKHHTQLSGGGFTPLMLRRLRDAIDARLKELERASPQ